MSVVTDIRFRCRACDHKLVIAGQAAGLEIRCPTCGATQTVPRTEAAFAPAHPPVAVEPDQERPTIPEFARRDAADGEEFQYEAFISYRHVEPDRRWAKWLHTALETYRVPKRLVRERGLPQRLHKVFRDEEELPASADLNKEISRALQQSRFLIVICSPKTTASEWVNAEVVRFRELDRHDQILALLIAGEPGQSFPQALREIRRTIVNTDSSDRRLQIEEVEPLAADVRPTRKEGQGYLRRMAKLRMLACILGVPFDDLRQREQERRKRRLAVAGSLAAALLAIVATLAGVALQQTRKAAALKQEAEQQSESAALALLEVQRQSERAIAAETTASKAQTEEALQRKNAEKALRDAQLENYFNAIGSAEKRVGDRLCDQAEALLWDTPRELRGWEWGWLMHRCRSELLTIGKSPSPRVSSMRDVCFSPDGRRIATADGSIGSLSGTLWDAVTGKRLLVFQRHGGTVFRVLFLRDQHIVTGSADSSLRVWDPQTGKLLHSWAPTGGLGCVAASANGRRIATGGKDNGSGSVRIWDTGSWTELKDLRYYSSASSPTTVAFSPDGKRLAATGFYDGTVVVWDIETGEQVMVLPRDKMGGGDAVALVFTPDGKELGVTRRFTGVVAFWDIEKASLVRVFQGHVASVIAAVFSPDGTRLGTGSEDKTARIWDVKSGQTIQTLAGHAQPVTSLGFSPDGGRIVTGSPDGTSRIWDTRGDPAAFVLSPSTIICDIEFSPDGQSLLWIRSDNVDIWSLAKQQAVVTLKSLSVCAVTYAPDGTRFATASHTGTRIWSTQTGKMLLELAGDDKTVAFSRDGKRIATGNWRKTARIRDADTGALRQVLEGRPDDQLTSVVFSPDGTRLVTGSWNGITGTCRTWDADTGREISAFQTGGAYMSLSADGAKVVGSGRNEPGIWDVASGKLLCSMRGLKARVSSFAFSPDGRRVVTGGEDGRVSVWDAASGRELLALGGHSNKVWSVAFSADGKSLAAGSETGATLWNALEWDTTPEQIEQTKMTHYREWLERNR